MSYNVGNLDYSKAYNIHELATILNAECYNCNESDVGYGVTIDTRVLTRGNIFVALRGRTIDGHCLINTAYSIGAQYFIVDHVNDQVKDKKYVLVSNTEEALRKIANTSRDNFNGEVIGVTGSVGKSTTKNWLGFVIDKFGKTQTTYNNKNSYFGVLMTLANLHEDTKYGVIEMGMSHRNEIQQLSKQAKPDIALITKVGIAHAGNFTNIHDLAYEKCDIAQGLINGGALIINRDEERYYDMMKYIESIRNDISIITFGQHDDANYRLLSILHDKSTQKIITSCKGNVIEYELLNLDSRWVYNTVGMIAVLDSLGIDLEIATKYFKDLKLHDGVGNIHNISNNHGTYIVIDDTFNANPDSMKAAIVNLGETYKHNRKIAILGDMLELGDISNSEHVKLCEYLTDADVSRVYCYGKLMRSLYDTLPKEMIGEWSECTNELLSIITNDVKSGDVYLIKGSHNSDSQIGCMYKFVEALIKL